jgi:hypothetical protein
MNRLYLYNERIDMGSRLCNNFAHVIPLEFKCVYSKRDGHIFKKRTFFTSALNKYIFIESSLKQALLSRERRFKRICHATTAKRRKRLCTSTTPSVVPSER